MNKTPHRNSEKYKEYRREYVRKYYKEKYSAKQIELKNARIKEIREWLKNLKSTLSCIYCGESDSCCIDFHHKDQKDKDFSISYSTNYGFSKKRILEEIEKCVPICSNCHRKLHAGRFTL